MYLHPQHQFDDPEAVRGLIDAHPLGAWVCQGPGGLTANHLPFVLDRSRGRWGTLVGHVSRANAVWRGLVGGGQLGGGQAGGGLSVVTFLGPQAYITPSWYPGKAEHGEVVPTWNYAVAHAHGVARAIEDRDELLQLVSRLTDAQEARRARPWRVSDAPAAYIEKMLRAIVGIEIPIERMEGKLKASQDEARGDRLGTVRGLRAQGGEEAAAMATLVHRALERDERDEGCEGSEPTVG